MRSLPLVLFGLALMHALVDTFAATIQPLWPDLERGLKLGGGSIEWAYVLWNLASSVTQPLFGYWGDRYRGTWLLWAGPALGVLCMSCVGLSGSLVSLGVLLVVGGMGISAFHPEAAALAGSSAPGNRSRAMSIFAVGGYLGQAAGPLYSGAVTTRFGGLRPLAWSIPWGLAVVGLLAWGLRRVHDEGPSKRQERPISVAELVRGKGLAIGLVLAIGILRVLAALGVPLALAYTLKREGASNSWIGTTQSAFLLGFGLGGLACAAFVGRRRERLVLWILPVLAAPCLLACPLVASWSLVACVGLAGLLLGVAMPILISYGQELLSEGQRLASSLTMGVTWGVGGMLVAAIMAGCQRLGRPELAFSVFAGSCVISSALCAWLPSPEESDPRRVATDAAAVPAEVGPKGAGNVTATV